MYPGQRVDFQLTANDNIGVTGMDLAINGQAAAVDTYGNASFTFDAVGSYTVEARAWDAAGNIGYYSFTLQVVARPDVEAPVVNVVHDTPGVMYPDQLVNFQVTAADNVGVVGMDLTVNGQNIPLDFNGWGSFMFNAVGGYTVEARAWDAAGNIGYYSFTLQVVARPDVEAPVVNLVHNAPQIINPGQAVNFTVSATDNISVTGMELTINGQTVALDGSGRCGFVFNAVGSYTVVATAWDAAGNVGRYEVTLQVVAPVDAEAPAVSIDYDGSQGVYTGDTVEFTIVATDNVGVDSLVVTMNGQEVTLDANGKFSYAFAASGVYTIVATAKDAAGNTGRKEIILVVL